MIDKVHEKVETKIKRYQENMVRYYNTKVKLRQFSIGDFILRKITLATKDPTQGKLGSNWEGPYRVIEIYQQEPII